MIIKSTRLWGKSRDIAIVDPTRFEEFLITLANRIDIPLQFRLFVGFLLCSGGRVSEVLPLKWSDVDIDCKFKIKILKKRRDGMSRPCQLHKAVADLFAQVRKEQPQDGRIFHGLTRHTALYFMRKHFGKDFCNHSTRHSFVSWLLYTQELPAITVCKMLNVDLKVVERYAHLNVAKEVEKLWAK